jgi:hypothetical protein
MTAAPTRVARAEPINLVFAAINAALASHYVSLLALDGAHFLTHTCGFTDANRVVAEHPKALLVVCDPTDGTLLSAFSRDLPNTIIFVATLSGKPCNTEAMYFFELRPGHSAENQKGLRHALTNAAVNWVRVLHERHLRMRRWLAFAMAVAVICMAYVGFWARGTTSFGGAHVNSGALDVLEIRINGKRTHLVKGEEISIGQARVTLIGATYVDRVFEYPRRLGTICFYEGNASGSAADHIHKREELLAGIDAPEFWQAIKAKFTSVYERGTDAQTNAVRSVATVRFDPCPSPLPDKTPVTFQSGGSCILGLLVGNSVANYFDVVNIHHGPSSRICLPAN